MEDYTSPDAEIADSFDEYLSDLKTLVAQKSISVTGEGIRDCAELSAELCEAYSLDDVRITDVVDNPAVIAKAFVDGDATNNCPTMLLYGHYDVQPVDSERWDSPPFEPTIRTGEDGRERLFARGIGDDKGQWFAHLCAIRALRRTGSLPMNVTLLLEGEEEIGSPNTQELVRLEAEALSADVLYGADGTMDASYRPELQMGSRGLLYVQVDVRGANRDYHSGVGGSILPNPAWELLRILETMKDDDGRITIDGFHEDRVEPSEEDLAILEDIPFDAEALKTELDVVKFDEGPGASLLENIFYQPTLNVAGFTSGYDGEGSKTVTPGHAEAKIDMRLFVEQNPNDIFEKFRRHVDSVKSDTVDVTVTKHGSMKPVRTPLNSPYRPAILSALEDVWDREPILKPSTPGSIPWYVFVEELGVDCLKVPYANPDQRNHSPNENLTLECFEKGIKISTRVIGNVASTQTS